MQFHVKASNLNQSQVSALTSALAISCEEDERWQEREIDKEREEGELAREMHCSQLRRGIYTDENGSRENRRRGRQQTHHLSLSM